MLVWEIHVGQSLFNAFFHELRHLLQLQLAEFFRHQRRFLARGLFIFLRMDRFQHGGDITDMFPRALGKGVAIPVHHTALPLRPRKEVSEDFIQAETLVRDDQSPPFKPHSFRYRRKLLQDSLSSRLPSATPRISRYPSSLTPTAQYMPSKSMERQSNW